jgi:hypothetical protein
MDSFKVRLQRKEAGATDQAGLLVEAEELAKVEEE